jgi:hypothetical protein
LTSSSAPDLLKPVVHSRRGERTRSTVDDWTDQWVCVGFSEQLACPGDLLPATISGTALHVRREDDGALSAALNARPFGGCMTVHAHCAGGRKIRCPYAACVFSEDPDIVSPYTEEGAKQIPQFRGSDPARIVHLRVAMWGSLIFVHLRHGAVPDLHSRMAPLTEAMLPVDLARLRAREVRSTPLAIGWNIAGRAVATALGRRALVAHRLGPGIERLTHGASPSSPELAAYLVAPHMLAVVVDDVVLVGLFRPVGPGECSLLGAVLAGADEHPRTDWDASWGRILANVEVSRGRRPGRRQA